MPPKADELERLVFEYNDLELQRYLEENMLFRAAVAEGRQRGMRVPPKPRYRRLSRQPRSVEAQPPKAPGRAPLLVRTFQAASVEVDGRTIEALIVPWDRPARVADPPSYEPYEEVWVRGAFDEQLGKRGKVLVNVEHEAENPWRRRPRH